MLYFSIIKKLKPKQLAFKNMVPFFKVPRRAKESIEVIGEKPDINSVSSLSNYMMQRCKKIVSF